MIHLTARKTHYHYTHKTNAARFASSACTLARRCSASNEQLLSAHSSSTDQSPRTHDARHRRIHMAKLRTVQKRKNTCFCLVEDLKGALIHLMKLSKASRYQKLTYRRNQKNLTRTVRVKMYNKCDLWLQSSESIKSQNFQQSKVWANSWFLHFRECWCKADGCLGFISPRSVTFFVEYPTEKNKVHQSTTGFRLFSLKSLHARIQRNNWLAGISGHVD